jgi:hypothetical protein
MRFLFLHKNKDSFNWKRGERKKKERGKEKKSQND